MFLTISGDNIDTMTGYMGGLVGDFLPVILVVLGVSLAMFIFRKIIK
jgi:hypothetical protein